jgi:hypothetical protein
MGKKEPSWGGDICYVHTPLLTHIIESSVWIIVLVLLWYKFNIKQHSNKLYKKAENELKNAHWTLLEHMFDQLLSFIHFTMYIQVIYYKFNISSLVNLIQPCHLVLLLEGIALFVDEPLGVLISVLILPTLTGTLLATLFPDTSGLNQPFEELSYWIQHILIQVVPLYLLLRKGSLALKLFDFKTLFVGLWILTLLHFTLYEVIDVSLKVNVEFMLCPTGAMSHIFGLVPRAIVDIPSYRTLMAFIVFLVGTLISYTYYFVALFVTKVIVPCIPFTVQQVSHHKKH